ncbi:hypothetical protein SELMODRAFT_443098 [Selaginella moellendorffii]|uniref:Uncharacterized protein n=1 Tax=Selaginella moellendorffii TaxID=88036 RepID=D8RYE2_SELML|nr:hypothetical protein SELMODRAFT_443098 [Selaginella moellendorffii]
MTRLKSLPVAHPKNFGTEEGCLGGSCRRGFEGIAFALSRLFISQKLGFSPKVHGSFFIVLKALCKVETEHGQWLNAVLMLCKVHLVPDAIDMTNEAAISLALELLIALAEETVHRPPSILSALLNPPERAGSPRASGRPRPDGSKTPTLRGVEHGNGFEAGLLDEELVMKCDLKDVVKVWYNHVQMILENLNRKARESARQRNRGIEEVQKSSKRRGFNRQSKRPRTRSQGPVRRTAQEIELELYNLDRSGFRLPYDGPELTKPLQGEWGYNELPRHKLYYWTPSEWPSKPAFLSDDEYKRLKEWKRPKVMIPLCTVDDAVPQAIEETVDFMGRAMLNGWNTP